MTQQAALTEFIYRLQEWRWPEALKGLQSDVLFVTDADIGEAITDAYGPFSFRFVELAEYQSAITSDITKLVFLCRNREHQLVRQARAAYDNLEVYSATYDLAPVSLAGGGYFEWSLGDKVEDQSKPLVVLAPPGSDADYLRQLLSMNGICRVQEYLNRTVAALAALQDDFEVFRFLSGVIRKHGQQQLQMILYTDVLYEIFQNTNLTLWRFGNMLKAWEAQVIYLTRRDKATQAALLTQLSGELGRSFWSKDHLAQPRIIDTKLDETDLEHWVLESMRAEARLEPMLTRLQKYRNATLEELVESPQEVLESIAAFIGEEAPTEAEWPDYTRPYKKRPNLLAAAKAHKDRLIEKLGLKLNEYGSYVVGDDVQSG